MTKSGFFAEQFERGLAVGRFEDLIALRGEPHAQQLADRRLVVDHEHAERGGAHAAASKRWPCARDRQADGEHGAAAVGAVGGDDGAVHGFDEAARDRKPEPGAGADLVGLLRAIELVEDVLEIGGRNAAALVEHAAGRPRRARASSGCGWWFPAARISRHCPSRLNSTCSNSTASSFEHRQIGREFQFDLMARQDAAGAAQRAADDLAEIVQRDVRRDRPGFELGHVEQIGDEPVEPFGFVDDGRQQIGFLARPTACRRDRAACRPSRARTRAAS